MNLANSLRKKFKKFNFILLISILVLISLRIPSLFEPHWYSDEGLYLSIANVMRGGDLLYKNIYASKFPGVYLFSYLATFGNSSSLIILKAFLLIASLLSVILIYKLARKLLTPLAAAIAVFLSSLLLGLPVLEANIASAEILFMPFLLAGIYFLLEDKPKAAFFSGTLIGISTLFGLHPFFYFLMLLLFLIVKRRKQKPALLLKEASKLLLGFLIPWILTIALFAKQGILSSFTGTIAKSELPTHFSDDALGFILFPNNILLRTVGLLSGVVISTYLVLKGKIRENTYFLLLWLLTGVYAALYYQKVYPHYLIEIVPILAIVFSLLIVRPKHLRIITFVLAVFVVLNLFTGGKSFPSPQNIVRYYKNFYEYSTGKIDTVSYIKYFGENTYRTYRLSTFLSQNFSGSESFYIWTNNPWIYSLLDIRHPMVKYLTSYEASSCMGEVKSALIKADPKAIVIDSVNSENESGLLDFLTTNGYTEYQTFEQYLIYTKD